MNIIFTDFDGVFNNDACFILHKKLIHKDCMEFFLDAVDELIEREIDIKFAISSTWRKCGCFEHFCSRVVEYILI